MIHDSTPVAAGAPEPDEFHPARGADSNTTRESGLPDALGAGEPRSSSGFGAGVDSSAPAAGAEGATAPRKRSRGGRGRRRKATAEAPATTAAAPAADARPAAEGDAPTRTRRRRSRRARSAEPAAGGDGAPDSSAKDTAGAEAREPREGADEAERPRRSRRRARTRKRPTEESRERGEGEEAADDAPVRRKRSARVAPTKSERRSSDPDRDADEAPESSGGEAAGEGGARKKRKRPRRRGGRGKSSSAAPVEVDWLPGEEDELPPEEEAEGEEESGGRGRKRRSRKRKGEDDSKDKKKAKAKSKSKDGEAKETKSRAAAAPPSVPNRILVNASDPEETRVAVVEDELITEFQMTVKKHKTFVNDIYRGKVVNLEPAIGAAFVDFGQGRNGFLHTSDVLSAYGEKDWSLDKLLTTRVDPEEWEAATDRNADLDVTDGDDDGGRRRPRRDGRPRARPRLPITDLLQRGQSVVVQVTKDAIGDKGPTLTTYISIPGRYLVLMPSMARTGVSRKIEDEKERRRLKRILKGLEVPEGMGVIVRTAGVGRTKADIKRDLDYLLAMWGDFGRRLNIGRGPMALYEESDVAIRTMRDLFNEDTEAVWVDDEIVHARMADFTEKLMPEMVDRIKLHEGPRPLFHTFGAEQDFERIFARRVELPSGGSIVFDQAEALVAIDVNSGKTRSDGFNFEEIALKANLEAVPEIARQIPLRDLGGIIVIDFIDMTRAGNRRTVEKAFRDALARDRARSKIGRISQFGLLEMTRQRLGPGLSKMLFRPCQRCRGSGRVRTEASRAGAILRRLGSALTLKGFTKVEVRAHPEVIDYLLANCSEQLSDLRDRFDRELILTQVPDQVEDSVLRYLRTDGREVRPGGRRKR